MPRHRRPASIAPMHLRAPARWSDPSSVTPASSGRCSALSGSVGGVGVQSMNAPADNDDCDAGGGENAVGNTSAVEEQQP